MPQRQLVRGDGAWCDAIADHVFLELVARFRATTVDQVVGRIPFEEHLEHPTPRV